MVRFEPSLFYCLKSLLVGFFRLLWPTDIIVPHEVVTEEARCAVIIF